MVKCPRCDSEAVFSKKNSSGVVYKCTDSSCNEIFRIPKQGMLGKLFHLNLFEEFEERREKGVKGIFSAFLGFQALIGMGGIGAVLAFLFGFAQGSAIDFNTGLTYGFNMVGYSIITFVLALIMIIPIIGIIFFVVDLIVINPAIAAFFRIALNFPNALFYWVPSILFLVIGIWLLLSSRKK